MQKSHSHSRLFLFKIECLTNLSFSNFSHLQILNVGSWFMLLFQLSHDFKTFKNAKHALNGIEIVDHFVL